MGILIYCPICGHKNGEKAIKCNGKFRYKPKKGKACTVKNIHKEKGIEFWVEYRILGKKVREKVGPSKEEARDRLFEVNQEGYALKTASAAERGSFMTLDELFSWFMQLRPVEEMSAYQRYKTMIRSLSRILGGKKRIRDLTLEDIDNYLYKRKREDSPNRLGNKISPKTVKEEIHLLRNILNRAVTYQKIDKLPVHRFPKFSGEDNIRKRLFTNDELRRMIDSAPTFMMRMIVMAQGTGMRQDEIVQLKWKWVDLDDGFVDIPAEITKNGESRYARIFPNVMKMLKEIPRFSHTDNVFLSQNNRPIPYFHTYCRKVFRETLEKAGIKDAVFHDLRHDFVTKAKRSGNKDSDLMLQVGHKTHSMLQRYHITEKEDLRELKMEKMYSPSHLETRKKSRVTYRTRVDKRP